MRKSIIIYQAWAIIITSLSDVKAGKLIKMVLKYGIKGEATSSDDETINAIFEMIKDKLNEDAGKYDAKVERVAKARENRKQNENSMKSICNQNENKSDTVTVTDTDTVTVTDTVTDTVLSKDNYIKKDSPTESRKKLIALVDDSDLSDPVKDSVKEWLEYKRQRKDKLTEVGFKKKLSEIRNKENEIGATRVIQTINLSMSNDWRGIIWDAVPVKQKQPTNINEWMQA